MSLPKRPKQHNLETISEHYFNSCLPENWTSTPVRYDYGVDLIVNIFEGENASPYELHVQLKASGRERTGDFETIVLDRSTFNHLKGLVHVVMLVKYAHSTRNAYYELLVKVNPRTTQSKSITIRIPKANRLQSINWSEVHTYIKEIIDHKITSAEALRAAVGTRNFNH